MHPVGFTTEAQRDILAFSADPDAQDALVVALMESLQAFPRAHHQCPRQFGARARYYLEGDFTIVFDIDASDPPGPTGARVAIRHVWPSRGVQVAELVSALRGQGAL